MVVQYTNRYTINKSVYRATGSGSDGVPFMAPDYKKPPRRGSISPWCRLKTKSAGLLNLI